MRSLNTIACIATLAGAAALAPQANAQANGSGTAKPVQHYTRSWPVPLDKGPFTAEASRAYQGGGMVLQGAPGAPPPRPQPTPPGQAPRNMVPQ
jgi:hypothetical protein